MDVTEVNDPTPNRGGADLAPGQTVHIGRKVATKILKAAGALFEALSNGRWPQARQIADTEASPGDEL